MLGFFWGDGVDVEWGISFLGGSQQKLHFVSTLRTKKSDGHFKWGVLLLFVVNVIGRRCFSHKMVVVVVWFKYQANVIFCLFCYVRVHISIIIIINF